MPKVQQAPTMVSPRALAPYLFHGLDLKWAEGAAHAISTCPWCGREDKFSVSTNSGLWQCFVCQEGTSRGGGNIYTFLRLLWEQSRQATKDQDYIELARERKFLDPETPARWGIVKSILNGTWLMPGHGLDGGLNNLYSYRRTAERRQFFPTTGIHHQIHGIPLFDKNKPDIDLCEGPWDGMALWEALRYANRLATVNVLAVPNCGAAGEPMRRYLPLFAGKNVRLFFDSDRPRENNGRVIPPAGFAASKRVVNMLASLEELPTSVKWLAWGKDGFDPDLPDGYDIRDWLSDGADRDSRVQELENLESRIETIPAQWIVRKQDGNGAVNSTSDLSPIPCDNWTELVKAWMLGMRMRDDLFEVLASMIAVALSTDQQGNQLFLQVIGEAGSGKTAFCDALIVCRKYCYPLEHLTGFHSGWKDGSGKDFSLIARINHMTLITPEADILMASPYFDKLMSEQRRIFDGTSGADFKNREEQSRHVGLRTPWIMAGTPFLLEKNQARLGDRFLKIHMERPDEGEEDEILRRVGFTALECVKVTSNCVASSQLTADLQLAYQLTAGYVNYLRANAETLMASVIVNGEECVEACKKYAQFTADLRAQPPDPKSQVEPYKELGTRLQHQFVRLAVCLAVVTGKFTVDSSVYKIVRRIAVDTARGKNLEVVRVISAHKDEGASAGRIADRINLSPERTKSLLGFLEKIGVVRREGIMRGMSQIEKFKLTDRMKSLYQEIMNA